MNDAQRIEQIVAEVVRRLLAATSTPTVAAAAAPAATGPASPTPETPPAVVPADTLVLDARVVTTDTIHGRLKGIRTLVVPPRAVVTPSVRDELRKRHVRLEHQEAATAAAPAQLTVVRYTRAVDAQRAVATLPLPPDADERLPEDLPTAVADVKRAVSRSRQVAVLVTDQTMAALCLVNRADHVRAAAARSVDDVRQAIATLGANVLIVDPRDMRANQWNVALQVFLKDLPRSAMGGN